MDSENKELAEILKENLIKVEKVDTVSKEEKLLLHVRPGCMLYDVIKNLIE